MVMVDILSHIVEFRNGESGLHVLHINIITELLLRQLMLKTDCNKMTYEDITMISMASALHDIGKIAIPEEILNKPGRLTAEEFQIMQGHSMAGAEILMDLPIDRNEPLLRTAYEICRWHHERYDGSGYPDGLKGDSIPICAQVVAIADCYDALTTDRVYKKAIAPSQAFSMILNGECGKFSPRLLECFKNVRDKFAQLSAEYADHLPGKLKTAPHIPSASLYDTGDNTLEQSQLKYFTLLRHMDSTVMELDYDTGVYHLVYLADQDFSALRSGNRFEDAIRNFAEAAVHPDDRAQVLALLDNYIRELFDEGLTLSLIHI